MLYTILIAIIIYVWVSGLRNEAVLRYCYIHALEDRERSSEEVLESYRCDVSDWAFDGEINFNEAGSDEKVDEFIPDRVRNYHQLIGKNVEHHMSICRRLKVRFPNEGDHQIVGKNWYYKRWI